jgi:RHS repeat-associated protein
VPVLTLRALRRELVELVGRRDCTMSEPRTRTKFTYDPLNRLLTAQTTSTYSTSPSHCWGEGFQYDNQTSGGAWGNLTNIGVASTAYNGCTQESLSLTATAQNRISTSGYSYDTAGNMTAASGATYSYDAENHLTSTAGVTYSYDGDGKRVMKSNGKIYWYGIDGSILDETDLTGSATNSSFNEYFFFGGRRIARRDSSNNVFYYAADHLGTSRVIAEVPSGSTTATLCYDADFYPFGGERPYTNTCSQNYKFTGKERDGESCAAGVCLDNFGARYDASSMGRFISADLHVPSVTNPQSLNKYAYALDNPLRLVDPDGLFPTPFHIEVSTDALQALGFSNALAFSTTANDIIDRNHFPDNALHAMSGDAAYGLARGILLQFAANPRFPGNGSESAVALLMGMHLVQDSIAHKGITSLYQHFRKYGVGDDKNKDDEKAAVDATQQFLDDFKAALVANLGKEGAVDALLKIQTAASDLSNVKISKYVNDLSNYINGAIAAQEAAGLNFHSLAPGEPDGLTSPDPFKPMNKMIDEYHCAIYGGRLVLLNRAVKETSL